MNIEAFHAVSTLLITIQRDGRAMATTSPTRVATHSLVWFQTSMSQVERPAAALTTVAGRTTLRFLRALMATFCDGIRRRKQLPVRSLARSFSRAIAQSLLPVTWSASSAQFAVQNR